MSIIRIIEGEYKTEIDGSWTVYTDEFEAYAGQTSSFTAGEGTVFGEPELPPIPDIHITKLVVNTDQDDGILESGKNGKGLVYGKIYEIEAVLNTDDWNWATVDQIKWQYKYTNEKGKTVSDVIKNSYTGKPECGNKIDFTLPATDCCGNNITIEATLNNTASTQVWAHYRFRWFDWKTVEDEMNKRMQSPWLVNQGATSLCGMAAIFYLLLKKDKEGYAKLVKELHHKGETTYNGYELKPHKDAAEFMYEMNPNDSSYPDMPEVDWLTLAVLRSKESSFFGGILYKGENEHNLRSKKVKAINWPWIIEPLCKNFLGYKNVNSVGTVNPVSIQATKSKWYDKHFDTALKHLEDIDNAYQNGHQVLMMIDSNMLYDIVSYSDKDILVVI